MRTLRRFVLEHRFAFAALGAWVVLLAGSAWVHGFQTISGSTAGDMISALAGSFGSVVLGAFGLESWQARQRRRQERLWVAMNAELLSEMMQTGLTYLAEIGTCVYSLVEPLLDERERVPDRFLIADVKRRPRAQDGEFFRALARFMEIEHQRLNGPLVVATSQARSLLRELALRSGSASIDRHLLDESWRVLERVAARVDRAGELAAQLVREISNESLYLPLQREMAEVTGPLGLQMAVLAWRLQRCISELVVLVRPARMDEVSDPVQFHPDVLGGKLVGATVAILGCVGDLRRGVVRHLSVVVECAADLAEEASLAALFRRVSDSLSISREEWLDEEWESWLRRALLLENRRLRVLVAPSEAAVGPESPRVQPE